jgi:hypothetical protein
MSDEWLQAAQNLSDPEKKRALESLLETADEPQAGIIRQILGEEKRTLTDKQQLVYDKYIEPTLVEKCGGPGCKGFAVAGEGFCPSCAIKYGE